VTKPTVLITGGTGKLGRIFTTHFANNGWRVIITSTNRARAEEFKKNVSSGENIDIFISDLSQLNAPQKLIESIMAKGIEVNHLVNNARSIESLKVGSDGLSQRDDMVKEYLLDVIVPYELATSLYARQKNALKTIVNIGSQYGSVAANPALYQGDSTQSPIQYGLAKSALNHLTKELAVRFSKDNIRVNGVAYGGVEGRVDRDFKMRYSALTPMGRMLKEEEVIGPLEFLLTSSSSSVTGHTIAADGGWTAW
jgi:NAD(P)-dependent dehydrogenase (short-subunit alcohol dehydrogenase family)